MLRASRRVASAIRPRSRYHALRPRSMSNEITTNVQKDTPNESESTKMSRLTSFLYGIGLTSIISFGFLQREISQQTLAIQTSINTLKEDLTEIKKLEARIERLEATAATSQSPPQSD